MALDAANFIAELSITDPPGSDPLSQGDDQIRTIKRATQQSFPNIDKAVTKTADQMNLMAILNEGNEFTANQTITGNLNLNRADDTSVRTINFQTAGINNWAFRYQTSKEFHIRRNDVLGVLVDIPWKISWTTGIVDFAQVPTVAGAPLWIAGEIRQFAGTASPGTNWFLADGLNGTVDLTDRVLMGSGTDSAGTGLTPNIVGTAASGTSGGTALTTAQLAAHAHRVWSGRTGSGITDTVLGIIGEVSVVGANRGNAQPQYDLDTGFNDQIIENSGSGNTHNHSVPSRNVTENGSGRDVCRPRSRVVEFHQYVP